MTSILLLGISSILAFIIGLFPTGSGFSPEVHNAFSTLGSYVGMMDVFIPIPTLIFTLTTIFSIEIVIFLFKIIRWVINHIPFIKGHN